jgi:hypothetical protein
LRGGAGKAWIRRVVEDRKQIFKSRSQKRGHSRIVEGAADCIVRSTWRVCGISRQAKKTGKYLGIA